MARALPSVDDGIRPMRDYAQQIEESFGAGIPYAATLLLLRAEREITRTIEGTLASFGLTIRLWTVLTTLHLAGTRLSLGKMAQRLQVHGTTVTNAVDQLVKLNLAQRENHPTDRRVSFATITAAGSQLADSILERLAAERFGWLDVNDDELAELIRVIDRFI